MNPPLVAHVIHRLGIGGLENGLVNFINHCPADRYRHAIVCLTEATEFRRRLHDQELPILEMHKRPGQDWGLYRRLWTALRKLQPRILHTRNFGALDSLLPARFAGVRCHVHGLHGWDVNDLHGRNRRYRLIRKAADPWTQAYIAVSRDLAAWAHDSVGIRQRKITQIYNGVDSTRFHPAAKRDRASLPRGFATDTHFVIGWVGRMDAVKNPLALIAMLRELLALDPGLRARLRLVVVGDGPLRPAVTEAVAANSLEANVWLAGASDDVAAHLRDFDVFVLPSLNEGISNTILEAMSSGLPVIAARVGGNAELIEHDVTGTLVDENTAAHFAAALLRYLADHQRVAHHGAAARAAVEQHFSMQRMVDAYLQVYDSVLH
jgi:sugar transferase (PEP-CTERM/EpsH1 system associated)